MTHSNLRSLMICIALSTGVAFTSCKGKKDNASENTTTIESTTPSTTPAEAPAPVEVAPDDALTKGVQDATKDYSGVKTEVNNGEVTLTGTIQRSQLPGLMMALNSLKPKKITNNLTIK